MLSGRNEQRAAMHLAARVHTRGVPPVVETVMIVNISGHGARVIAQRAWQPRDQVVLTELIGSFHVDAEVVYCQRIDRDKCAVGLKFAAAVDAEWPGVSSSGTWPRLTI
jgi:hypothetical protein